MANYYGPKGTPMTFMEWADAFEHAERRIGRDQIGKLGVSTVWLGLDHNFGGGPPLIFETMIFGLSDDEYQERYPTLEDAQEGHQRAIEWAKAREERR